MQIVCVDVGIHKLERLDKTGDERYRTIGGVGCRRAARRSEGMRWGGNLTTDGIAVQLHEGEEEERTKKEERSARRAERRSSNGRQKNNCRTRRKTIATQQEKKIEE